ncbi:methyl-CpG-binding domain protein 2-like [Cyprinus carpio]|uniref:Methyl-CpG-binding domain protein 2-like n=1 Tax=Cyprinus carpio TaxID=7962 RepID=A0A9Q9W9S0_CYPCA|nr:methyl-CpG-binding domain protein 2-like [Cyprinus carpio]
MQVRARLEVSGPYYRNIRLDLILMIPGRLTLIMERERSSCSKPQLIPLSGELGGSGMFRSLHGQNDAQQDAEEQAETAQLDNLSLSKLAHRQTDQPPCPISTNQPRGHSQVVNHPNNKVKTDPQRATEQPRQLFWERRLKGLRSSDVSEEALRTMDLPKGLQSMGPDSTERDASVGHASALHMSSAPITGQTSSAAEKNPSIWLNTSQPLCKAFTVTDDDIREQELKVQSGAPQSGKKL